MNRQSWLLNLSLLKTHPAFRAVFLARFISIVSLGLLGVAVPVQIQMMTQSTWQVGLSVTLTGSAMFIGLMVGGVLADRYERKKVILLARGTCGIGFIGLCLVARRFFLHQNAINFALPEGAKKTHSAQCKNERKECLLMLLLSRITFVERRQADPIFESYITM